MLNFNDRILPTLDQVFRFSSAFLTVHAQWSPLGIYLWLAQRSLYETFFMLNSTEHEISIADKK